MLLRFKQLTVLLIIIIAIPTIAWHTVDGGSNLFSVSFRHKVGNKDLVLFDETYSNPFNEPFTVNRFRYYISNVLLTAKDGRQVILKDYYHLVDEVDSSSKQIIFNTSGLAQIVSMEFLLGVDSIKNVSGVQTGDLDPMKGMFWTWNSGYVFAKIDGQSDSSHSPANYFSYHVGGFKSKENALRRVKLAINSTPSTKGIVIETDINKWFNAVHPIKVSESSICHEPGRLAMKLADNYATMFSIAEVK